MIRQSQSARHGQQREWGDSGLTAPTNSPKCRRRCRDWALGSNRASMVYLPGTQTQARRVNPGQLLEMFDSSWRVRNIWDGVRLEVAEDPSPVVLHSFTHLDPDLPLVEVSRGLPAGGGRVSWDGQEKRRWRVGRIMRFVVVSTMLWGQIDDSGWIDLYDSRVT